MPKTIRHQVTAPASRFFKPRLHPTQVRDLHLLHELLLDDLLQDRADERTLWELVAMAFTWSRTAELLGLGEPEIAPQLELATRLVERYGRTGLVVFRGVEYQLAKLGIDVMDQLAEIVDKPTAQAAADWSEASVQALADANAVRLERAAA